MWKTATTRRRQRGKRRPATAAALYVLSFGPVRDKLALCCCGGWFGETSSFSSSQPYVAHLCDAVASQRCGPFMVELTEQLVATSSRCSPPKVAATSAAVAAGWLQSLSCYQWHISCSSFSRGCRRRISCKAVVSASLGGAVRAGWAALQLSWRSRSSGDAAIAIYGNAALLFLLRQLADAALSRRRRATRAASVVVVVCCWQPLRSPLRERNRRA